MPDSHFHHRSKSRVIRASDIHRVPKEWGEEQWIVNRDYCGKKLVLKKNRRCSLHAHKEKDEVFSVVSGVVLMEIDGDTYTLRPGDSVHIQPGEQHRFTGLEDSVIMEFSTHHSEEDSYRSELSGHAEPVRYKRQMALLHSFKKVSVLVVGDVMLDRYVLGDVERISPEAPVPVVLVQKEWAVAGGAANSAANIRSLGAKVKVVSVVGNDAAGKELMELLTSQKISTDLLKDSERPTVVKERIIGKYGRQIVRVDREVRDPLPPALEKRLVKTASRLLSSVDAVLVSDYGKGVVSGGLLRSLLSLAKKKKIPVIIDPKPHAAVHLADFKGATLLTPNTREAALLSSDPHAPVEANGKELSSVADGVLITRGEAGLDIFSKGKKTGHFDSHAPEVVDVSGAGDTVAAVATLVLAAGGSVMDAADMGNRAAGVVVRKQGTAVLSPDEFDAVL